MILLLACAGASARPLFHYPLHWVGHEPGHVLTADLNHDGALDLVTTHRDFAEIRVSLGNGDGTFEAPVPYPIEWGVWYAAFGDFDSDGWEDLAAAPWSSDYVSILMGNGDGTFGPATAFPAAGNVPFRQVAVGDFDHDDQQDLVVGSGWVLIGRFQWRRV
jgi:hypothetical protein